MTNAPNRPTVIDLRSLGLPPEHESQIFGGNAVKLFRL